MGGHVRRVDEDLDGALRAAAVAEHGDNPDVFEMVARAEFSDDRFTDEVTYADLAPRAWRHEISGSGVPMLVLVSWLDAGTIEGALLRARHFENPQKIVIMATSHGGGGHASPYVVSGDAVAPAPSVGEQFALRRDFFDRHLKGVDNNVDDWPRIRYYNLGEEAFRETERWPPGGVSSMTWFLGTDNSLSPEPQTAVGSDAYAVDFDVSTGANNRWRTQMGQPVLNLDDRGAMDARMLTYTSAPLDAALQITGTPTITLHVASDHEDGALLAYLEDVDPAGRSRYITEGGVRLIHRRLSTDPDFPVDEPGLGNSTITAALPYRSYARADSAPMVAGRVEEVTISLWATSVRIQPGHRLRLAIAGAESGTLERAPTIGNPTIRVFWGVAQPSTLTIPMQAP